MKKEIIFDSKINKQTELEIRDSDAGQIVFVPYSKEDRCNKCALCLFEDSCQNTPCNEDDRRDKLTGYYRKYRAYIVHEFSVPTITRIIN